MGWGGVGWGGTFMCVLVLLNAFLGGPGFQHVTRGRESPLRRLQLYLDTFKAFSLG